MKCLNHKRFYSGVTLLFFSFLMIHPQVLASSFDHQHRAWTQILKQQITSNGGFSSVDYLSLKRDPKSLDAYLKSLEKVTDAEFHQWNEKQQIAFLINAYNAFTLKLIVTHYPVGSIKSIGNLFKSPWKIEFFKLMGQSSYLDYIEHELLRKQYQEPRIHFALVCASISCPPLLKEAFVAEKLEEQFQTASQLFLTEPKKNRLDQKDEILFLSKIFRWYGKDFKKTYGHYLNYIAPFLSQDPKIQQKIKDQKFEIKFLKYDWNLNDKIPD